MASARVSSRTNVGTWIKCSAILCCTRARARVSLTRTRRRGQEAGAASLARAGGGRRQEQPHIQAGAGGRSSSAPWRVMPAPLFLRLPLATHLPPRLTYHTPSPILCHAPFVLRVPQHVLGPNTVHPDTLNIKY